MPSTVRSLFEAAGVPWAGVVRWGQPVPERGSGAYVVALSPSREQTDATVPRCPIDLAALEAWLAVRPELRLDGRRPSAAELAERISAFWLPDEVVLYIGKATSLASRVNAYYITPLGARRPHAGGHLLKTLASLRQLHVHFGATNDPAGAEDRMLASFCSHVSESTRARLRDPGHPFPFANLEWPRGVRKNHGITGGREPAARDGTREIRIARSSAERAHPAAMDVTQAPLYRTQRITEKDLMRGQIRIPVAGPTKSLFPAEEALIRVEVRGAQADASWDPCLGPDRERSGVLRFSGEGRRVLDRVGAEEICSVRRAEDGLIVLE